MAKKNNDLTLNVGTSSVLFIFVILCLVSFSVLSLSSAVSDYKLTERVGANSTAYYEACNNAEDILATTDATLKALYDNGISRTGYFEQVGHKKSFAVYVTDVQTLLVEIRINYPSSGENFYDVISWQLITTGDLEYDESLPVYK